MFARQGNITTFFEKSNIFGKIFFMKRSLDLEFEYNILVLALVVWVLLLTSCTPKKCTKRQEKKATKHWVKGMATCPEKMAKQSLLSFPITERIDTFTIYKEGQYNTDTLYIEDVIHDTIYRTKVVTKTKTDTLVRVKEVTQKDTREIEIMSVDLSNMKAELIDAQENNKSLKNTRKTLITTNVITAFALLSLLWLYVRKIKG